MSKDLKFLPQPELPILFLKTTPRIALQVMRNPELIYDQGYGEQVTYINNTIEIYKYYDFCPDLGKWTSQMWKFSGKKLVRYQNFYL